jgi:hypothetical protein
VKRIAIFFDLRHLLLSHLLAMALQPTPIISTVSLRELDASETAFIAVSKVCPSGLVLDNAHPELAGRDQVEVTRPTVRLARR